MDGLKPVPASLRGFFGGGFNVRVEARTLHSLLAFFGLRPRGYPGHALLQNSRKSAACGTAEAVPFQSSEKQGPNRLRSG
jgi:hypothetical protein